MSAQWNIELNGPAGQRLVGHIMVSDPARLDVASTLGQAAAEMEQRRISSLLVVEAGRPVAILTERDVIRALGQGMLPDTSVTTIMTRGLITAHAGEEVHAAYHRMALHDIRHLVVVDESGATVGIVSETDFRKHRRLENFVGVVSVSKAMSQNYLTMPRETSTLEAARAMQQGKFSCVLVSDDGRPAGIVTERDMVKLFRRQAMALPLSDVMTTPVIAVTPDLPLVDAVRQMQVSNIRHLVVVDQAGLTVGVLDEHDTVRQLEDEYIHMLQQLVVQQARELNEDKFRAVVNQLPHQIMVKDVDSVFISCNESCARELGIRPQDIVGKTDFDLVPEELARLYRDSDRKVIEEGVTLSQEQPYYNDGRHRWIHITRAPMRDASGSITGVVVIYYDITEKKLASDTLARNAWTMSVINAANRALLFAENEERLLQEICLAITQQDRYPLAWIGWADSNPQRSVTIAAVAGRAAGYLEDLHVTWADDAYGRGPTGQCIREGSTVVNNDAHDNPAFRPWQERAERFHIRSSVSIPFRIEGLVAGALVIYANEVDAFRTEEVELFESLASNLGYGLGTRRTREAYEAGVREKAALAVKLEASLEGALMAIAATLEQRDPYTAGHERNVAALGLKIAQEMGLDEEQLKALHLSAIVHDLGKIQVPAEILTKPGRLNAAEFALIKLHPENGYEILSKVNFPWPIAEIIRQHHEYLDGSGYPRGLKGDQILPLARILTVADIVESMSSDRPYRAALGMEQAVSAIMEMRGSKLDPVVVDACANVIRRGGFEPSPLHRGV